MKPIALVLLNYNGIELLKKFLNDVISNSLEADIVLIDNNSIDNFWKRKIWDFWRWKRTSSTCNESFF